MCRHFLITAYHELGGFPLLDAGRGNLEEQFDGLPAALLISPVLLQLPRGHTGVGARAAVGIWKDSIFEDLLQVSALGVKGLGRWLGLSGMGHQNPEEL